MPGLFAVMVITMMLLAVTVSGHEVCMNGTCVENTPTQSTVLLVKKTNTRKGQQQQGKGKGKEGGGIDNEDACKEACADEGFCCSEDIQKGSNQYLSCAQACTMVTQGKDVTCNEPRSCNIGGWFNGNAAQCSSCKCSENGGSCDGKCNFGGAGNGDGCKHGISIAVKPPVDNEDACKAACANEGFCCSEDIQKGSNQYLSCAQACTMVTQGKDVTCNEPRSCNIGGWFNGNAAQCSSCKCSENGGSCDGKCNFGGAGNGDGCKHGISIAERSL